MAKAKKRSTARRTTTRKSATRTVVAQRTTQPRASANTNITTNTLLVTYVLTFVSSAVVLYAANMLFPNNVVLGTLNISMFWAIVYSMGALALVNTAAVPFMYKLEEWKGRALSPMEWMSQYFVLNFTTLYVVSRFSEVFGLGISSWLVVAVLAAVVNFVQGMVMMQYGKMQEKK